MPFDDSLLTELIQTARDVTSAFDRYVGLSPARAAILLELSRCGERSQADLQRHNKVHGASITRQVQAMEADGLLVRRPDPADNRFTLVMLTEAGHEALAEMTAKREAFRAQLLAGVPEADREGTWRFLRYIRDRLPHASPVGAVGRQASQEQSPAESLPRRDGRTPAKGGLADEKARS